MRTFKSHTLFNIFDKMLWSDEYIVRKKRDVDIQKPASNVSTIAAKQGLLKNEIVDTKMTNKRHMSIQLWISLKFLIIQLMFTKL